MNYTSCVYLGDLLGEPTASTHGSFRPAKSGSGLTLSQFWTTNPYGDRVSEIGNFDVKVNKCKQFFVLKSSIIFVICPCFSDQFLPTKSSS